MKKTISGLLALLFLLSMCVGCGSNTDPVPDQSGDPAQNQTDASGGNPPSREGHIYTNLLGIDPSETAFDADGTIIPAELYFYWLTSDCAYLQNQLQMYNAYYGAYDELLNEDGTVKWDGELEGMSLSEIAKERTKSTAMSCIVLEKEAAARNITLTDEDKAGLESYRASYAEQLGGQEEYENILWEMGISQESFDRINTAAYLYQHLLELAQDPESDIYQAPADTDVYADHILLTTIDPTTQEPLSEEEIAAKKARAEELLAQLQAADPAELEELFTQLADENSEDTGRTAYPDGYFFGPGEMATEFEEAAFALQPGEISGIVETRFGYHIILRKALTEEHLASIAAGHLVDYLDGQAADLPELTLSEKLAGIDVGAFYADYVETIMALHPELASNETGENGGADGSAAQPAVADK